MTDLSGRARNMLEEQLGLEERTIDTYSYYSSQAGNPALSSMLNEFVREKSRDMETLRSLLGVTGKKTDAFEEQVYQNQAGGPNPGGYRPGGTAGTETIGSRPETKPAGDNVGFEAAQLEFGWYELAREVNETSPGTPGAGADIPPTHFNNYGKPVTPPPGSVQSTDVARGEMPSGGYMTAAFTGGVRRPGSHNSAANEYIPWATSDDDAIIRDVAAREREVDRQYSSIADALSERASFEDSQSQASETLDQIREGIRQRIKRVTAVAEELP